MALRVMKMESGGNEKIHNYNPRTGDDSWGCFQINRYGSLAKSRPSPEWLIAADNNVQYAIGMHQASGWGPWSNTIRKLGAQE